MQGHRLIESRLRIGPELGGRVPRTWAANGLPRNLVGHAGFSRLGEFFFLEPRAVLAEEGYGNEHPTCENQFEISGDRTAECDAVRMLLEQSACRMADKAACSKPVRLQWESSFGSL